MLATIIIIGDEILSGTTQDGNSHFLASELRKIGVGVRKIITVADDEAEICGALSEALSHTGLVFLSGGLGPTNDDKTKSAMAGFFSRQLIHDPRTFAHLEKLLTDRSRAHLLDINRPQAEILEGARVFQNDLGTAPCQMIEADGSLVFSFPGVPAELKVLFREKVLPWLRTRLEPGAIATRTITVADLPESLLAKTIAAWEQGLPKEVALSYLPAGNSVRLKLTATGSDSKALEKILDGQAAVLKPLISENVIAWHGEDIQEVLGQILNEKALKISVAESCTGGQLAKLITSVPSCSTYFEGGAVTYSEIQKTKILGVPQDLIERHGVVSAEVVQAMSLGCRKLFDTDIALATTGAAGPDTDRFGTPVGTIFYSVRIRGYEFTQKLYLPHLDRQDFVRVVSRRILQDLAQILYMGRYREQS